MRREYLIPVLSVVPVALGLLLLTQYQIVLSQATLIVISVGYVLANIAYSVYKKTFHPSVIIELCIVALIAFVVINQL